MAKTRQAWTAIGRATGRHRTLLIATCVALVVAAVADEATGYDGPGPFIYPAFAVVVALARWRYIPLLAAVMSAFFLFGGLVSPQFTAKLTDPAVVLDFTAGWVQMLSFVAAGVCAVAAVVRANP
ncbi:hypothetical protein [Kutzneria sp. 744]|uniref:hypothetical protein n=1 Tax=Kutzneria sp. (strain 744) TaxID=345341 RepID=UPI0003EECD5D|nr:hypothetical protein [Kutzneria sp. 744]EWM18538.1 hypothetical protein KUTG_08842 [Kutzneria sp. 744]